jgi:hypothetical protein
MASGACFRRSRLIRRYILWEGLDECRRPEDCLTHARNIIAVGYEFEADMAAIS